MKSHPPERGDLIKGQSRSNASRFTIASLATITMIYALLAGLHTLQDFDLGWQLATGRWVLQHHQIFSTDVFSHTAQGAPWIYPVLSGIVFYLAYVIGGYALLSWMGALACAATIALLLRQALRAKSFATAALALIAVPLIANRTQPRAEMFTTALFAAFLSLLWGHHRSGRDTVRAPLWLLPILMVAWVNLHPGFVAGLALCAAYVFCEILDMPFQQNREAVRTRVRHAWPWLAMTVAATSINPWGASIYRALARQQQAQRLHTLWVVEWERIRPSWASLRQALDVRDPQGSFWWLLAIAVACAGTALYRKRWGATILLLASAYLTTQHVRLQALFACVVVVVGGALLKEVGNEKKIAATSTFPPNRALWKLAGLVLITTSLTVITAVRCWDLVTNRYYLRSSQLSLFGTGLSWWFPERAIDFLSREKLPANLFNTYNLGGYLTWRLYPDYLDYIDSRALPFGAKLFFRAYELSTNSPDSQPWQQEGDARNLNTVIVSLARYNGLEFFPQLPAFCHGQSWRPVYMDVVSAIFVRRTPQTESLINRLQIDCDKISFAIPEETQAKTSTRNTAELFNSLSNAAGILYSLGRYTEAFAYLDRAQSIFSDNASLHLTRALLLDRTGHAAEAESEFRTSLNLEPKDETWLALGLFYMTQKRYADAAEVFRQSANSSSRPHDSWMLLGQAYVQMDQPQPALQAFDKAVASSPFREGGESLGADFNSMVATGRAKAWYQLGDLPRAVTFQEDAVKYAPNDSKLWLGLADLYDAQGRTAEATRVRSHAMGR